MKRYKFFSLLTCCVFLISIFSSQSYAQDWKPVHSGSTDDKIHYININPDATSDSFLVESNGQYLLVDTSNPDLATGGAQAIADDTANVNAVIAYLSDLGISSLDYVVMTHNHSDHIGGVTRLCQEGFINADTTVFYRSTETTQEEITVPHWENARYFQMAIDAVTDAGAKTVCLAQENITEYQLQLGDFSIEFLNLDNDHDGTVDFDYEIENNNSIVLLVTKGTVDTLLTADIEQAVELALSQQLDKIEVLKVPHHGNRTSSSYEFLKSLQPETAVITAYGYVQSSAYAYLQNIGTDIYTTGNSSDSAIVELVMDDGYEIQGAAELAQSAEDGWYTWLDHDCYVENGQIFRDGWKRIGRNWYYFNEDGVMQTDDLVENGRIYSFRSTGEWIRNAF